MVSADTESARETKTKHLLMEGMVMMQGYTKERKVDVRGGEGRKKESKALA